MTDAKPAHTPDLVRIGGSFGKDLAYKIDIGQGCYALVRDGVCAADRARRLAALVDEVAGIPDPAATIRQAQEALTLVNDAYAAGPDPRAVRDAMDSAIDYVRAALRALGKTT